MSEPNYGKDRKKICFDSIDKFHADLRVRLHYDGLKQYEFFNLLVKSYLEKEENIMNLILDYKEKKQKHSHKKRKRSKELIEQGRETENIFALDPNEVESIFDLIEKENSDI